VLNATRIRPALSTASRLPAQRARQAPVKAEAADGAGKLLTEIFEKTVEHS
jgi:hypothetical protein